MRKLTLFSKSLHISTEYSRKLEVLSQSIFVMDLNLSSGVRRAASVAETPYEPLIDHGKPQKPLQFLCYLGLRS